MKFGPHHYVPVLKVKRGEKKALEGVSPALQPNIIPLLEIVERKAENARSVDEHLTTAYKGPADSVRRYSRCFLDAGEIAADGQAAAHDVFSRAKNDGMAFTPVTGVTRTIDVSAALENREHGIALRLTRPDFEAGGLPAVVEAFLLEHSLDAEEVDLIIDLGAVEDLIADGIRNLSSSFLANVPFHDRWRTFTLSACAFPRGLGAVDRNSHAFVTREEWIAWRDHLHASRSGLARLPSFSDGAIQHPTGVEGFDFRIMQVSAAIRYTLSESWLLIKGEGTRFNRPALQFPTLATRLVYGQHNQYFTGPGHCDGCASMKRAADGAAKLGSAEVWRRLGTIHHITSVVESLEALPWP